MKLRKYRRAVTVFGVFLLLIGVELGVVYGLWWRDTHHSFTVEINNEGEEVEQDIEASFYVSKKWADYNEKGQACVGAEYDGTVRNNMDVACKDWELRVKLPKEVQIDSSWNGEYMNTGDEIVVIPDEERNMIYPGDSVTIGFVGYSYWPVGLSELTFIGYRDTLLTRYPGFWPGIFALFIWVCVLIGYILVQVRVAKLDEQRQKDETIINQMMDMFADLIDTKDKYTKGHSTRVSHYAKEIARRMHLGEEEIRKIGYIALLHDIGKIGIPDQVLKKPESLTGEERTVIKEHTIMGGKVLENFTAIEGLKDGALYHHERFDGTGYPFALKGEEIPFYARIIGVADSFDTMNSDRCYRDRLPKEKILEELRKNSGTQFDPEIVKYMIEMIEDGFIQKEERIIEKIIGEKDCP